MAEKSQIQWTQATWNPWHGCRKVSDGCKYCYMFRDKERYGQDPTTVLRSKSTFNDPLKWKEPKLVFTCSWSDWFIEDADEWRGEAWEIIKKTPHLTYQILTKRPENIANRLPADWGNGYKNVWIGVSVENQKAADQRIPLLLESPASVRFLSCEPLLEDLDLSKHLQCESCLDRSVHWCIDPVIDWVIVGGESGNKQGKYKYRGCQMRWIESLVDQCRSANVPVFIKQLGTNLADVLGLDDSHGGDITEFPKDLQIRQMPV
jgi:protein gp37